jgi:hypothetical protein
MQRSTVLFLLVGCIVAAVVAIIVFSGPGDVVAPPGAGETEANAADPNRANGSSGTGASDSVNQRNLVSSDVPHVRITVTSKEQFVAPPQTLPLAVSTDGRLLQAEVLAGVGAGFDAEANRRGVALIAIDFDGGRLLRQVTVDPSVESVARVGARVVLRGRVQDTVQKPVPGATVWLGEFTADGSEREYAVDQEGAFEANVPAGEGVPFVVHAPGFASTWRTMTVSPTSQPLSEVLQSATSLSIQLAARADGLQSVRVFVVPQAPVSTGVSQWPFFRQCLSGGYAVNNTERSASSCGIRSPRLGVQWRQS